MNKLDIDWSKAPSWANWAAQDADGSVWLFEQRPCADAILEAWDEKSVSGRVDKLSVAPAPSIIWTATLTCRPSAFDIEQPAAKFDPEGMLRAQIDHLLEDMTPEQLDALYAHVRKQLDGAKFDELNRQLDKPFGEVPREWQLKAFEAFLDGHSVFNLHPSGAHYTGGAYPTWAAGERYRVEPKQS